MGNQVVQYFCYMDFGHSRRRCIGAGGKPGLAFNQRSGRSEYIGRKGGTMPKRAEPPHDLRIEYAGNFFMLAPRSPAGEQWVAEHVTAAPHWRIQYPLGAPLQQGVTAIRLRCLDEVLAAANAAGLRLEVPWDDHE
jgi:hypothetical protein